MLNIGTPDSERGLCWYINPVECEIGTLHVIRLSEKGLNSWVNTEGYMLVKAEQITPITDPTDLTSKD